jgi:hypothetical protein
MKKVILSAAIACIAVTTASAQTFEDQNGTATVVVTDYINLSPSGGFGNANFSFANPQAMVDGISGVENFTVVASRAWKFMFDASDFTGGTPGPGVSGSVPASQIMTISSTGDAAVNTYGGNWINASSTPTNMAWMPTGTTGNAFNLHYKVTPGLANQMSGTYTSTIHQIASLN